MLEGLTRVIGGSYSCSGYSSQSGVYSKEDRMGAILREPFYSLEQHYSKLTLFQVVMPHNWKMLLPHF